MAMLKNLRRSGANLFRRFLFFLAFLFLAQAVQAQGGNLFYPTREEWRPHSRTVNISIFVFNDINQNGEYDLGDRPMAGITTGLSRNASPLRIARSNVNGFANYPASEDAIGAIIDAAGTYQFEVFAPPGWQVSTGNQVQEKQIIARPDSKTGLVVMGEVPAPVGLRRVLFVRGTYGLEGPGRVSLMQGDTEVASADLTKGEEFLWLVDPGEYRLQAAGVNRPVKVGAQPVDIGTIDPAPLAAFKGQTINFENMTPSGLLKAPNGYGGLNWFNLNMVASTLLDDSIGYVNGATSGNHILYTSAGHRTRIFADTPFDMLSVNLAAAWPESEGETVIFDFYRGETRVRQERIGVSAWGPINFQPLIPAVTKIEISTAHYWQAVLDDLVVNIAP